MRRRALAAAIAASTMAITTGAGAAWTFTASSGTLSAQAIFDIVGGNLQVVLSNIGGDVLVPADVLTALFFDIPGVSALTPVSAVITAGSTAVFDAQGQPAGGVVGGEWAYGSGLAGAPGSATEGIGSSGFGLFGGPNFPGVDLDPPTAVNGMNYGLLSASDNLATGNAQVTGNIPFVQNSVTFTLSGIPVDFDLSTITHVSFQYGTALTEPNIPGSGGGSTGSGGGSTGSGGGSTGGQVPEPSSTSLALLGVALLGASMWKRRKSMQG